MYYIIFVIKCRDTPCVCPAPFNLTHKNHDRTYVVLSTIGIGCFKQLRASYLGVRGIVEYTLNLRIAHHLPQAIRTTEQDISRMQLLFEDIDLNVQFISQAAEDLAALWMGIDILWLNQPACDKLPHQRMIVRQLIDLPAAHHISTAIPDIQDIGVISYHHKSCNS